jgi:hypothetical protein
MNILVIRFASGTWFLLDPSILCSQALFIYFPLETESRFHSYKTKDKIACRFVHFKLYVLKFRIKDVPNLQKHLREHIV